MHSWKENKPFGLIVPINQSPLLYGEREKYHFLEEILIVTKIGNGSGFCYQSIMEASVTSVLRSATADWLTFTIQILWRGEPDSEKGAGRYWNVNKNSAPLLMEIRQVFFWTNIW